MRTKSFDMQIIKITLLIHCFVNETTIKRSNYLNFNVFLLFFQCFFNKKTIILKCFSSSVTDYEYR